MKKISSENIFKLFEIDDVEVYEPERLKDLMSDDHYLLNMCVRGIENFWVMDKISKAKHGESYNKYHYKIKTKYFLKMFNYLNKVNLNRIEPFFDTVQELGYGTVENSLKELMDLFIELEYYEKCAKIKRILDLLRRLFYPEHALD